MKRLAFLSMDSLDDFVCYDHLAVPYLEQLGWQVDTLPWTIRDIDWNRYQLVIIRSTWDYQSQVEHYLQTLQNIDKASCVLLNDFETVRWNIDKHYLQDLQQRGIEIVPTRWFEQLDDAAPEQFFKQLATEELVIKPCISAGATHTYRITRQQLNALKPRLLDAFRQRAGMAQPFMPSVINPGEYSLFFFNGSYSHSILKKPQTGDFRVQEEHGGQLSLVQAEASLLETAERVMQQLPDTLYARIDLVRGDKNYLLMEAELIEPSLYFNMDPDAAERFALAIDQRAFSNP